MNLEELTRARFKTLRVISIAQTRTCNPVWVDGLMGTNPRSVNWLLREGWLKGHPSRCTLTARARGAEQRWLKGRHDTELDFDCSRCGVRTDARDGGGDSGVDPNGDYCATCYLEEVRNLRMQPR